MSHVGVSSIQGKWGYHYTKVGVLCIYIDSLDSIQRIYSLIILVGSLKSHLFSGSQAISGNLDTFSTDSPGELDILGHDGNSLGMDGAQVSVQPGKPR